LLLYWLDLFLLSSGLFFKEQVAIFRFAKGKICFIFKTIFEFKQKTAACCLLCLEVR